MLTGLPSTFALMMPTNEYGRDLMGGAMGDYSTHSTGYGNGAGMVSHFFGRCWRGGG